MPQYNANTLDVWLFIFSRPWYLVLKGLEIIIKYKLIMHPVRSYRSQLEQFRMATTNQVSIASG